MNIRVSTLNEADAAWGIIEPILRAGETCALPRDWPRADALAYWYSPDHTVFVAQAAGKILGTYLLHANQQGGGAHVANCG
jgi:hypothetical protein